MSKLWKPSRRLFLAGGVGLIAAPAIVRAGSMSLLGAGKASVGGATFVGPGDIVGTALGWWGLRGYSAAYATGSNAGADLVDQAGANPITINILSNGTLDVASNATWVTAHSVTTIKIAKLYDQSGNALHMTQATLANMPVLTLSAIGSLPGMTFTNANSTGLISPNIGVAPSQPITFSAVAKRTGSFTTDVKIMCANNGSFNLAFASSANTITSFAGSGANITAADSAFHAVQWIANGASSVYYLDSASTAISSGTNGLSSTSPMTLGFQNLSTNYLSGLIMEAGFWGSGFSAGNQSSMDSNQRTYWGF